MASTTINPPSGRGARLACTRFGPMKPAPPVIRTLCIGAPWLSDTRRCFLESDKPPPLLWQSCDRVRQNARTVGTDLAASEEVIPLLPTDSRSALGRQCGLWGQEPAK